MVLIWLALLVPRIIAGFLVVHAVVFFYAHPERKNDPVNYYPVRILVPADILLWLCNAIDRGWLI